MQSICWKTLTPRLSISHDDWNKNFLQSCSSNGERECEIIHLVRDQRAVVESLKSHEHYFGKRMFRVHIDGMLIRIRLLFQKVSIRFILYIRRLDSSTSILTAKIYYTSNRSLWSSFESLSGRRSV